MSTGTSEWSFDRQVRVFEKELRGYWSYQATRARLLEDLKLPPYDTLVQCTCSLLALLCSRHRVASFAVATAKNSPLAGQLLHLYWRDAAFGWYIYIEECRRLAEAAQTQQGRQAHLPIGKIDFSWFTEICMTMALAAVLGGKDIARRVGGKCMDMVTNVPAYCEPAAWQVGPVQGFMVQLYMHWRGHKLDVSDFGFAKLKPFQTLLDSWDDAAAVEATALRIAKIHGRKAARDLGDDNDLIFGIAGGIGCVFPVELLFLQRVRRDLGLSVPNPDHPLMRSPAATIPLPCERSGYDDLIAEVYAHCQALQPGLHVPWEDEMLAAGPNDPRRVPPVEVGSARKGKSPPK